MKTLVRAEPANMPPFELSIESRCEPVPYCIVQHCTVMYPSPVCVFMVSSQSTKLFKMCRYRKRKEKLCLKNKKSQHDYFLHNRAQFEVDAS
jgi:hypothetical protein